MSNRLIAVLLLFAIQAASPVGSVTGSVHDAAGAAVGGLVAVIFPADETAWPGAGSAGTARRGPVTAGRFEIAGLPAGSYKLVVVDESLLADWPSPVTLSQLVKRAAFPLQLTSGQPASIDIEVHGSGANTMMSRIATRTTQVTRAGGDPMTPPGRGQPVGPPRPTAPGSISGRVTGADGRPAGGMEVRAVRRVTINGASTLANFGASATTDADGRYSLPNRQAGTYLVVVVIHASMSPFSATARPVEPSAASGGPRLADVATFYGNTLDELAATPVTVTTDDRSGTDIQIARVPAFTLTGSIARDAIAVRTGTMLTLVRLDPTGTPSALDVQRAPIGAGGAFHFADLADGEYELSFGGMDAWARARVRVAGRDPDPMVITPQAPMIVRGRIEFQGSTPPPAIPGNSPQWGVELAPVQSTVGAGFVRIPLQADGTFAARGTGAGPFRLRGAIPAPWIQVAGFVGGVDTLDVGLAAGPDADGALIVFADRPTAFRVTIIDGQGQPVANAGVILFHEDPRYWTAASRRVQTGTTLPSGTCTFTGLPPGRYFAATGPDVTSRTTVLQVLIQRLRPEATPFELTAGQSGAVQLPVKR